MVGIAFVGLVSTFLLMAGLSLSLAEVLVLCGVMFLLGLFAPGASPSEPRRESREARLILAPVLAVAAAFVVLFAINSLFQPLSAWDAWQQWTAKARSIVLLQGLDKHVFTDPTYLAWNQDYPLLVPALEAIGFRFMGLNEEIIHLQFTLIVIGFVVAVADLLRDRVRPLILYPLLVSLLLAPSLAVQAGSAQADVPLAAFVGLAGVSAWRWIKDGRVLYVGLLALFSAAALATKLDGLIYIGALFVILIPLVAARSPRRGLITVGAGILALVGIVPWKLWVEANDVPSQFTTANARSLEFLSNEIGRVPRAADYLLDETFGPESWLFIVPLALLAALLALVVRRFESALLVIVPVAVVLAAYTFVYWASPFNFEWHLGTSASRVVVGLVVVCGALAPAVLSDVLGRDSGST